MTALASNIRQKLSRTIAHYTPFDDIETCHQTAILNLIETLENPLDRDHYDPGHITASAWVVAEDTQQVGLIYHTGLQCWLQPGGHIDPGETDILAVAIREVAEEMGVILDPARARLFDLDVHAIPERSPYPAHYHYDIRYLCLTKMQPIIPASDVEQGQWFSIDELTSELLNDNMQRMLNKCFQSGVLLKKPQL